jgi:hypothetical protein
MGYSFYYSPRSGGVFLMAADGVLADLLRFFGLLAVDDCIILPRLRVGGNWANTAVSPTINFRLTISPTSQFTIPS